MREPLIFDPELIRRYDRSGPRYTSYPTAAQFHGEFSARQYLAHVAQANMGRPGAPLSLYLHIPFCATVCFYCACNKVVTRNRNHAKTYLAALHREIEQQGALFDGKRRVEQLHWGGGTPTFLSESQMQQLMDTTRTHFNLGDGKVGEFSIEIDPRTVSAATMPFLRLLGFNRLSLGVQDFEPQVQKAVNRLQSSEQTFAILDAARAAGFKSINMDLIYGLPRQTVESFDRTLCSIIAARPDRLSVFNYAHLPDRFKTQRQINAADLPPPAEKLKIMQRTVERLEEAGYVYIGMDHFARPDDELARAQQDGGLCRNFQGYSTHGDCDLIGMGMSAISMIGHCYAQNQHSIDAYEQSMGATGLAISRGVTLTPDDILRREVIMKLICNFKLDCARLEQRYDISFWDYFANERTELHGMEDDGLLQIDSHALYVLPPGRLLIRNICMVFDAYLRNQTPMSAVRYSKVI